MRELTKDYAAYQENLKVYNKAKDAGDTEGMAKAREQHEALMTAIDEEGGYYPRLYRFFENMKDRGNDYIDLSDPIMEKNLAPMIDAFRTYGITHFYFSSTWSSAVETAWAFIQSGCTLKGITEIYGPYRNIMADGYEKAPAYLFKVN